MFSTDDTIVAIASAPGPAARGIVRVTGTRLLECLNGIFCGSEALDQICLPRAIQGTLTLPALHRPLDATLLLWPGRRSYTRQPTAEVHTIGSPPLLEAIVSALCAHGARPARPGEFTLRAFLAGRIDLTQAEAVLGVIDAGSRHELDVALSQMAGGLAGRLSALRDLLADLLAHLEAGLDFVEEEIEFITRDQLLADVRRARRAVDELLKQMAVRATSDELVRAVLVGEPNAGKSTLFNALVGNGRAIVSDMPGTTRDYLVARLDLDGIACELVDTAGVDAQIPTSAIDRQAQAATAEQHRRADVVLRCVDGTCAAVAAREGEITICTKSDLLNSALPPGDAIAVSAKTGTGLDALREALRGAVVGARTDDSQVVASTAARARTSLERAAGALEHAERVAEAGGGEELVAADLRAALDALGEVVGTIYTEDILDRIFSRFCIGK
ncbi:MAG TPA: GTPase [Pirellulales bacterium]|jgi:tRNA modification GTPase|nr:GTPase [Pirellulales bacterium]